MTRLVIIPAAAIDDVEDTIDSVLFYEPNATIILIKDHDLNLDLDSRVLVLPKLSWPSMVGGKGAVFQKKLYAFKFILANFQDYEYVISLDADAVFLKSGIFEELDSIMKDRRIGIAGTVHLTKDGSLRNFEPIKNAILQKGGLRCIHKRSGRRHLDNLIRLCGDERDKIGTHALGGMSVFQREMIESWDNRGWLFNDKLHSFPIPEDGLMGLLAIASGFTFKDIGGPTGIIDLAWRGLPRHPKELVESDRYVTHSVRSFKEMNESEIRTFFSIRRSNEK
jgi:hypothetical protein